MMYVTILLLSFALSLCVLSCTAHSGCYHSYTTISEIWRSTANEVKPGSILKCDRSFIVNDNWYRFDSPAGNEMPTTRPAVKKCGTYMPIWLNGKHPTVAEGDVDRTACVNIPRKGGCSLSYNIKVVNCSGFYLYQLKKPHQCPSAYCAGM